MGDLIEITTWPKTHNVFYKITSNVLAFEIKASGNAAVGLSSKPENDCDYWILIGERQRCCIKRAQMVPEISVITPDILSVEEYRKFWLTWSNGQVCLRRDEQSDAIVFCANSIPDMKYVTFSVVEKRNPVHWRFEIPPTSEKMKYRPITGGELHWATYEQGKEFPVEPLIGGFEKEKLYIARANHRGSVTPGKLVPSTGKAHISWGGQANEKTDFEVLCGFDGIWVPSINDQIPVGAFIAGYSEMGSERLFIGRAEFRGHLIPGKIHSPYKKCLFSYQGKEVESVKYEILVVPKKNQRCVNRIFLLDSETYVHGDMDAYDVPFSDDSNNTDDEQA